MTTAVDNVFAKNQHELSPVKLARGGGNLYGKWLDRFRRILRPANQRRGTRMQFQSAAQVLEDRQMLTLTTPQIISPAAGSTTFDTTPRVQWTADSAAMNHEIWVSETGTSPHTVYQKSHIVGSTFSVPSTLNTTSHRVWIRSFDSSGQPSEWSPSRDFSINSAVPTNLNSVPAQTPGSITMSWAALPGAQTYTVWVSDSVQQIQLTHNLTSTSYSLSNLNIGEAHRFWVRGKSADGSVSGWSSVSAFTPGSGISQQTPQLVGPASSVNTASVQLTWQSIPQANAYTVWVSEIGGAQVIVENGVAETSFRATDLPRAKSYRYWIRTVDEYGVLSNWSVSKDFYLPELSAISTLNISTDQTFTLYPQHVQGTREIRVAGGTNLTLLLGQTLPVNSSRLIIGAGASVTIQGYSGSYLQFPIGEVLLAEGASLNVQDAILSPTIIDFGPQAAIRSHIPGLISSSTTVVADRNKADTDFDDLPDIHEVLMHGTLSDNADSDGDLLTDGFEVKYGLNPWSWDSIAMDADNDGLSLLDEQIFDTNPFAADSDGDGVNDFVETNQGSNPQDPTDNGIAPPTSELVSVTLTVGDHSGSESERYALRVGRITHQSAGFGVVSSRTYKFRRGTEHEVRVLHYGSNVSPPDFDYTALVVPTSDAYVMDPLALLGVYDTSDLIFRGAGLSALLVIPGPVNLRTDIDTDSDNNGSINDTVDDAVEHLQNPPAGQPFGKRIFVNSDDDNQNGIADSIDGKAVYTAASASDNDFAQISLETKSDSLINYAGYELWLAAESGLKLWRDNQKTALNAVGGNTPDQVVNVNTSQGEAMTWYVWQLDGTATAPFPATIYAEGITTGKHEVYWRLLDQNGNAPGSVPAHDNDFAARDTITISVEDIVWPNQATFDAALASELTSKWDGLSLEPGWTPSLSLQEMIANPSNSGEIRTLYPEIGGIAQNGEGPDSYTTLNYSQGFTLEVDVKFDSGYVQAQGQPHKLSFFANSGIKIWDIYEIAIFDSSKVWNLPGRTIDSASGTLSAPNYSPNEGVTYLMSGVPYGSTADNRMQLFDTSAANPYQDLMSAHKDLLGDAYSTLKITFAPVPNGFSVNVWIDGQLIYSDPVATNGTGGSGSGQTLINAQNHKVRFQSHWDSGVKFQNLKISGPPQ